MSREQTLSENFRKAGWGLWAVLFVTVTFTVVLTIIQKQERSVTFVYRDAATNWFAGRPLYNMYGHGFIYLPHAALAFAPWAFLPHYLSELLWRWTLMGLMAATTVRLVRILQGDGRWFFVITLVTNSMAWGCARNGQATLMITALSFLAITDLIEQKWSKAAALLTLAFAFKPLAIVPILLVAVLYPQTSWRLLIGAGIMLLAPFATQRPEYVWSQYVECIQSLRVTFGVGDSENWAQLFGLLQVMGLAIPSALRTIIRAVAAGATLGVCWYAKPRLEPKRFAFFLFSIAGCYLMLFNSRTEGSTYAMVGQVYGALLAEAMFGLKSRITSILLSAAAILSVLNFELAVLVSPRPDAIWISPLVCVCVTAYLMVWLVREMRKQARECSESNVTVEPSIPVLPPAVAA